ncbi:MAG: helix-turn-helix domain-containing protein [Candidatus Nanopelagicales bacterium]
MRVRLLGLLRTEGPATASQLAARVSESSGVTSYHLRQLAVHGFIVEDETPRSNRRERWWRAAHRYTELRPIPDADAETRALADGYLRSVAAAHADRIAQYIAGQATTREALGRDWSDVGDLSDYWLDLTSDEAAELGSAVHEVLGRFRSAVGGRPPAEGRQRVAVQLQAMPTITGRDQP